MSHVYMFLSLVLLLSLTSLVDGTIQFQNLYGHQMPIEMSSNSRLPPYRTLWYTQQVDHFNFNNNSTWKQKYIISSKHYVPPAPILFYTGNEGDIEGFYNNSGFLFELAEQWNAAVIFGEHRYYGESLPFGNKSFEKENIQYLTVEQALADYAVFLSDLKSQPEMKNPPILSFGGSYGGMLTAWLRMKYPGLVIGGLASSAPIFYLPNVTDPYLFDIYVTRVYAEQTRNGVSCADVIKKTLNHISQIENKTELARELRLCQVPSNESDVSNVIDWLSDAFVNMAMTNYPDPNTLLSPLPAWPVNVSCEPLLSYGETEPLRAMADAMGIYYNPNKTHECYDYKSGADGASGGYAWDYQSCTELVLPMGSNSSSMFPQEKFDWSQLYANCQTSMNVVPRPSWIGLQYGGLDVSPYSNIIFSNGDKDPWRVGGVNKLIKESLPIICIAGSAHHQDLRFSSANDSTELIKARELEGKIMSAWIYEYYALHHPDLSTADA